MQACCPGVPESTTMPNPETASAATRSAGIRRSTPRDSDTKPTGLPDTEVICNGTDAATLLTVGSLGADFVRTFRQLTINYERMFIRGE